MGLRSRWVEVGAGVFVLIIVVSLILVILFKLPAHRMGECYILKSTFSNVNGLAVGDEVRISGVKIGSVSSISLDKKSYIAEVEMCVSRDVALSVDSIAKVSSKSVIEGRYINVLPGIDSTIIHEGGAIENTQSDVDLSTLLSKIVEHFLK